MTELRKVLWFNWRDLKNPNAGGAEVFTHEVAKRLVRRGWSVTLFTSRFDGAASEEQLDGVEVVRRGGRFRVYHRAKDYARTHLVDFDIVVDEINTRPFMTPKFVRNKPIVALIHQLAKEYWFYETPWPISWIGYYYLERAWLENYLGVKTITVSESTRSDLTSLGFTDIHTVPEGLSIPPSDTIPEKETDPTLVFLGRLKRVKKPEHAIWAFELIRRELPETKLWIIGDGYLRKKLQDMAIRGVEFKGRVEEYEKVRLISRAHVLLYPAVREGWGLSISEANARGTPAVGYVVPGVKDAIKDGQTGFLVEPDDWRAMASKALILLKDEKLRYAMANRSIASARQFDWGTTTTRFMEIVQPLGLS